MDQTGGRHYQQSHQQTTHDIRQKINFSYGILDADAVDTAIFDALAGFYRHQHTLITDAITHAQHQHHAGQADRHAELATVQIELTKTAEAIDRYLTAFERGTISEEMVAGRLIALHDKTKQLRTRHDELTATIDDQPTIPHPTTLTQIANHITTIITTGSANQRKALVEALIDHVKITGPDRLTPAFRIPQPPTPNGAATAQPAETVPKDAVRTMPTLVGQLGLEPTS